MRIKKFHTGQFAGMEDRTYQFEKGMNVLYGENEAGKSTLIDAIYYTLFKPSKLDKRRDGEFIARYFHPNKDSIDASLTFESDQSEYTVYKKWGTNYRAELAVEGGVRVEQDSVIQSELQEVLGLGEATYRSLVFSSQNDAQNVFEKMLQNPSISQDLSHQMAAALTNLDGVSIEALEIQLQDKIKKLAQNWDETNRRPKNNRGIDNPYKTGIGEILKSFYAKEENKRALRTTKQNEETVEQKAKQLTASYQQILHEKNKMEEWTVQETDATKRSEIEKQMMPVEQQQEKLKKIATEWPVITAKLETAAKQLEEARTKEKDLSTELEQIEQQKVFEEIKKRIETIEEQKKALEQTRDQLNPLNEVTKERLETADKLEKKIWVTKETVQNKGYRARVQLKGQEHVQMEADFDPPTVVRDDTEADFAQRFRLEIDKVLSLDIEPVKSTLPTVEEMAKLEKELKDILEQTKSESASSLQERWFKKQSLEKEQKEKTAALKELLGEETESSLKEKMDKLRSDKKLRTSQEVMKLREEVRRSIYRLEAEIEQWKNSISSFQEVATSLKDIQEDIIALGVKLEQFKDQLKPLRPIPKEFNDVLSFMEELNDKRRKFEEMNRKFQSLREEHQKCSRELGDETYEDLLKKDAELTLDFDEKIKTLETMRQIEDALEITKRESLDPIPGFSAKLAAVLENIAGDHLRLEGVNRQLMPTLVSGENPRLDYQKLSEGTKKTLNLAFRIVILEHLFDERGILFLDDATIDMDAKREDIAIDLLKKEAKTRQIMFCTCREEIATKLGGNRIDMEKDNETND